jgi:methyltransferase (TIGR00027 family)
MHSALPSRTALRVALRRAAHQLYDAPKIFDDPIAIPILGTAYLQELERTPTRADRPFSTGLRAFIVARSRYAEDNLARAVATGVTQYVLLGAGLDTFAYRNPWPQIRVFEVDHPATQQWKRELLDAAKIPIPANLAFAPVDFETQSLPEQLSRAGFDRNRAAFFAWLGVVPYLTLLAFRATVTFVTEHAVRNEALSNMEAITSIRRTGITLDYGQPRSALPLLEQLAHDSLAERVRLAGEPFQLFFTSHEIAAEFSTFSEIEDIGTREINARYFPQRRDNLSMKGSAGRFLTAWL